MNSCTAFRSSHLAATSNPGCGRRCPVEPFTQGSAVAAFIAFSAAARLASSRAWRRRSSGIEVGSPDGGHPKITVPIILARIAVARGRRGTGVRVTRLGSRWWPPYPRIHGGFEGRVAGCERLPSDRRRPETADCRRA